MFSFGTGATNVHNGQTAAPTFGGGGGFGTTPVSGGAFGSPPPASGFAAPTSTTPAFGGFTAAPSTGFGAPSTAAPSSGFGFGSGGGGGFGSVSTFGGGSAPLSFGAAAPASSASPGFAFGSSSSSISSPPSSSPFGGPGGSMTGAFGASASQATFSFASTPASTTTAAISTPFGGGFTAPAATANTSTPFGGGFGAIAASSSSSSTAPGLPAHLSNLTNPNNDYVINDSPIDTISSLHFSSSTTSSAPTFLASSSWSRDISVWEIQTGSSISSTTPISTVSSILRARHEFPSPMLCCAWNGDNSVLYGGGADSSVVYWDLTSDKSGVLGNHSASVKEIFSIPSLGLVCSASWDRTIKYWDVRVGGGAGGGGNPVITVQLPERAYCADVKNALLVVGCAERKVQVYNLRKPSEVFKQIDPPLRFQLRSVSCFPDETGFALGSIEGRVAITYVADKDQHRNFAFKCHRESSDVYAINGISFHPTQGTFITVGSDGSYVSWDKESKQRLKLFPKTNNPLTCGTFSSDGNLFAYAVGYDWSRGVEFATKCKTPNGILIHRIEEAEVKRRK